jgi:hypothetical protein
MPKITKETTPKVLADLGPEKLAIALVVLAQDGISAAGDYLEDNGVEYSREVCKWMLDHGTYVFDLLTTDLEVRLGE